MGQMGQMGRMKPIIYGLLASRGIHRFHRSHLSHQPPLSPGHLIVEHPGLINSHGLPCDTRWPIFEIASVDLGQNPRRGYTANFVLGTIRSVPNKSGFEGRQLFSDEVF